MPDTIHERAIRESGLLCIIVHLLICKYLYNDMLTMKTSVCVIDMHVGLFGILDVI